MSDRHSRDLAISKRIAENKLKAFSIGKTNPMPKKGSVLQRREKEIEKKKLDIEETQNVFDEFVQSFEDIQTVGKTFIRGTSTNPDPVQDIETHSKLYNPVAQKIKTEIDIDKVIFSDIPARRRKTKEMRKSVLESFKEELKRTQKERDDRHTQKNTDETVNPSNFQSVSNIKLESVDVPNPIPFEMLESGDSVTTNLYVGNINQKMNEDMLCQVFGKFGALASVKVMWPRTDEEKARNHNCGFVAYMKREHAMQALNELKGTKLLDFPVQLGWGKPVPLPLNPVYVHPDLIKIQPAPPQLPDPPSGLPFNAQYKHNPKDVQLFLNEDDPDDQIKNEPDILLNSLIRITIPPDGEMQLIHRMIEFVVREGPMFEAMIMTKEINNPEFRFLFDNQSPQHIYYRWKLFSILQGDSPETWQTEDFRLFENGSIWRPPPLQPVDFPDLKLNVPEIDVVKKGCLSNRQRDDLEDILRELLLDRKSICFAMAFCIDHSESSDEVINCITESLVILETPLLKKVARLHLISDIINNSTVRIENASTFRNGFEKHLEVIFSQFATAYEAISDEEHAEHFKILVLKVLFSWERQTLFSSDYLIRLKQLFLPNSDPNILADDKILENLDGQPMENFYESHATDLDGVPMDSELDGEPMQSMFDQEAHEAKFKPIGSFISVENEQKLSKSKWELIDDPLDEILEHVEEREQVQRIVKPSKQKAFSLPGGLSGQNLNENMRLKLREIEVKVAKFAEELESLDNQKGLGNKVNRVFMEQKIEGYRKLLLEDFYQTNSLDTEADNHPVSMDISKTSKPSHAAKASKFFSQYTDSESENLIEESYQKGKKAKSRRSHKSESRHSRDAPIYHSRSRSYSFSDTPNSDLESPPRGLKSSKHEHGHHSKKSKRPRHDSSSPLESRSSRKDKNKLKDKSHSRSRKRHSNSNSPTYHIRGKSSKKSRHQSSDSQTPSPHKRSKKSKHH